MQAAVASGAVLVPCLALGETALYRQIFSENLRKIQIQMAEKIPGGFSLPLFRNDSYLKPGLLPNRVPTYLVIGEPIFWNGSGRSNGLRAAGEGVAAPPATGAPAGTKNSEENNTIARAGQGIDRSKHPELFRRTVRDLHAKYLEALQELHAKYKHLGTAEDQDLEIVSVQESRAGHVIKDLINGQKRMDALKREGRYLAPPRREEQGAVREGSRGPFCKPSAAAADDDGGRAVGGGMMGGEVGRR